MPPVGTWIEINQMDITSVHGIVVPPVGTWIEISSVGTPAAFIKSCPPWARGLKWVKQIEKKGGESCPPWARGLKF